MDTLSVVQGFVLTDNNRVLTYADLRVRKIRAAGGIEESEMMYLQGKHGINGLILRKDLPAVAPTQTWSGDVCAVLTPFLVDGGMAAEPECTLYMETCWSNVRALRGVSIAPSTLSNVSWTPVKNVMGVQLLGKASVGMYSSTAGMTEWSPEEVGILDAFYRYGPSRIPLPPVVNTPQPPILIGVMPPISQSNPFAAPAPPPAGNPSKVKVEMVLPKSLEPQWTMGNLCSEIPVAEEHAPVPEIPETEDHSAAAVALCKSMFRLF